jgi:tetratricopeptide (TPR) repeat protein
MLGPMKTPSEKTMTAVVHRLGDRLARAQTDRIAALLELMARHLERGKVPAAMTVGLEAVEGCATDLRRRCDALTTMARGLIEAEAHEMASELAARAIHDAAVCQDVAREARARELQGSLLLRRGHHALARQEFRIAGMRHRQVRDTLSMKRAARQIGNCYRLQATAAAAGGRPEHAEVNFKQALRAYRAAQATGEFANDDAAIAAASAECEARRGNYGLARIQLDRALALAPRVDDAAVLSEIHLAECRLLRWSGDLRAAEWAGERACQTARTLRDDTLAHALQALADVHDAQGRFERASDVENQSRELLLERHRALSMLRSELAAIWRRDTATAPGYALDGLAKIHA